MPRRSPVLPMLVTLVALGPLATSNGCQCRFSATDNPADVEISGDLDFGEVPDGMVATHTLFVHGVATAPQVSADSSALSWRWLGADVSQAARLVVACDPGLDDPAGGALTLDFAGADPIQLDATCEPGERPPELPDPLLEVIDTHAFSSVAETLLGDATIAAGDGARLVLNPPSGDVFLSDPVAGRLWRQGPGYLVPGWGAWLPLDMEVYANWNPFPPCIDEGLWNRQDGTCTGVERNGDGSIPENWAFVHSGFVGDTTNQLDGVRMGMALPGRELMAVVGERSGESVVAVIDAGLAVELGDESPYSYLQLVRQAASEQPLPEGLLLTLSTDGAWLVEPNTGATWLLQGLDQVQPQVVRSSLEVGTIVSWASMPQGLLLQRDDASYAILSGDGLVELEPAAGWGSLDRAQPDLLAGDGQHAWAWFAEPGLLAWRELDGDGGGLIVPPASVQAVHLLVADSIYGGAASPSSMAWLVAETTSGGVELLGAQAEYGVVESAGVELPGLPLDMAVDGAPHDLYLAWPAGSEGCDGDWSDLCSGGEHPALIQSGYASYGLVPPTSTGHLLHMFINPILETPKDNNIDMDFSRGEARCGEAPGDFDQALYDGCCALEWAVDARVVPNLDYVLDAWTTVGGDTQSTDDDVAVVVGLNPTWLRQARHCYAEQITAAQGFAALEVLATYRDLGLGFTHWTHTSMADPDATDPMGYFMGLLYEPGVDYDFPMDSQAEYQLLHDGMYAATRYDDLPDYDDGSGPVVMATLEVPLQVISGNHFDGAVMVSDDGWPGDEPSWIRAGRDGPLALGDPPFQAYYFASAGSDPAVGLDGFRKKELMPVDIRRQVAAFEMGEDPEDWFEGGDSGVLYLPGHSWALNTLGDLQEAGLYRESQVWGTETEARDWEQVSRHLRRVLASSQPDDIKVWYLHVFDFTNTSGMIAENSGVTADSDVNVDGLEALNALLVHPGYARWAQPDAVVQEWIAARGQGGGP